MGKTGIQISNSLKNKITNDQDFKENIEKILKQKSGGKCFLCSKEFNYASDLIHADHDIPDVDGGETSRENLNLTHSSCNKFKRDNSSLLVKRFLPFRVYLDSNVDVKFDKASKNFFNIKPKPIVIEPKGKDTVIISFPNGTKTPPLPIYSEKKSGTSQDFEYIFLQAPASAIINDEVQPRNIKSGHIYKIFQDLHYNPLHEPSSVRLKKNYEGNLLETELLMFDGQHKTISKMLYCDGGNSLIDLKLYLNLSVEQATVLVNTIQSKIIKLGLSKSEFASKMGDEYAQAFTKYEIYCSKSTPPITPSEDGFIKYFDKAKQSNAKKTLIQSRINSFLQLETHEFNILEMLENKTKLKDRKSIIKETTFINKVIQNLLYTRPIQEPIGNDELRTTEKNNIKIILNLFFNLCLSYDESTVTDDELIKVHRLKSQSSLVLFTTLIRKACEHIFMKPGDTKMFTIIDLKENSEKIESAIDNYGNHPIWVQDEQLSTKVMNFYNALQKNQVLNTPADEISLDLAYLLGVNNLTGNEFE